MVDGLKSGEYAAVVADASRLELYAQQDESCSLHTLKENLGEHDTAFAFRSGFSDEHPGFVERVSERVLQLQEEGVAKVRVHHLLQALPAELTRYSLDPQISSCAPRYAIANRP